jgi:hypothetical protein
MSILIPSSGYAASGAQARGFLTESFAVVEILEKILILSCFSFPLRPSREFLNLPKNRQISERSSPLKIPTHHAKLKFCRFVFNISSLSFEISFLFFVGESESWTTLWRIADDSS